MTFYGICFLISCTSVFNDAHVYEKLIRSVNIDYLVNPPLQHIPGKEEKYMFLNFDSVASES